MSQSLEPLARAGASVRSAAPQRASEFQRVLPALVVASLYLAVSLRVTEFRRVFEIDPDEGNNLIKALLLDRGHGFLSEIWSDQPPLFAYALWGLFELFGWKVGVARELVLASSALLVFAVYDSTRVAAERVAGAIGAHVGALIGVAFLLFASGFAVLRVSVMIGMPSIALAALSLSAALRAGGFDGERDRRSRRIWLATAGGLLGLSLATKLFTAFLAPVVVLTALAPELGALLGLARARPPGLLGRLRALPRTWLSPSAHFLLAFCVVLLFGLSPALFSGALSELYLAHAIAESREYRSIHTVPSLMARDWLLFALALAGVGLCFLRRASAGLPWALWLLLAIAALSRHDPLWGHHNQLMIVPGAVLAGSAVALLASLLPARERAPGLTSLAIVTLVALALSAGDRWEHLVRPYTRNDDREWKALAALRDAGVNDGYVVTSRQIYAFYLELPVPPLLSVTSAKRFRSGRLNADTLVRQIREYPVNVVILSQRWPGAVRDRVRRAISSDFEQIYRDRGNQSLEIYRRRAHSRG